MISTPVCAAPAGIDGSGRVRVPSTPSAPWAFLVTTAAPANGAAMPAATGVQDVRQPVTPTPFSTLGNHLPGRPQS
jgi:hypothetical protein